MQDPRQAGPKTGSGEGDLRQPAPSRLHTTRAVGAHQAAGVVAHVPQGNKSQGHPGAILRGNLVLSSHNGRDRPPATIQRKEADKGRHIRAQGSHSSTKIEVPDFPKFFPKLQR